MKKMTFGDRLIFLFQEIKVYSARASFYKGE